MQSAIKRRSGSEDRKTKIMQEKVKVEQCEDRVHIRLDGKTLF
jgi:hypothetical protein